MNKILSDWSEYKDNYILYEYVDREEVDSLLEEGQDLIDEGIGDLIKQAYKKGSKLKGKLKKKVISAMRKLDKYLLKLILKLKNIMGKSIEAGLKFSNKVISFVKKFKDKHPTLFKISVTIIFCLIIFAVISIFDADQASALIKHKDTGIISDTVYEQVRGFIGGGVVRAKELDQQIDYTQAMELLDKLHNAKDVHDIANSQQEGAKIIRKAIEVINNQGDSETSTKFLKALEKVGEGISVKAKEISSNSGKIQNVDISGTKDAIKALKQLGAIK